MKRIKISLMTLAIAAAVCSAFATKKDPLCYDCPQYYLSNGTYYPAGIIGYNYDCDGGDQMTVCTYYRPDPGNKPNDYWTCNVGFYIWIQDLKGAPAQTVKK